MYQISCNWNGHVNKCVQMCFFVSVRFSVYMYIFVFLFISMSINLTISLTATLFNIMSLYKGRDGIEWQRRRASIHHIVDVHHEDKSGPEAKLWRSSVHREWLPHCLDWSSVILSKQRCFHHKKSLKRKWENKKKYNTST